MAYQPYIDNQICGAVPCRMAVIAGLEDGVIQGKFENGLPSKVTQEELKVIADAMRNNPQSLTASGLWIGGEKYFILNANNTELKGRKDSSSLCIVATNKWLVAAATTDGFPPGQLNAVVEKLGDNFRTNNQ